MVIPLAAAVPDEVSLLEQKLIHPSGTWYAAIDLADAFFSIPVKGPPEAVCFQVVRPSIHCTALPQGYINSPVLCYN